MATVWLPSAASAGSPSSRRAPSRPPPRGRRRADARRNERRERGRGARIGTGMGSRSMHLSCLVVVGTGHRAAFTCNDEPVDVEIAPGESLLSVFRERLGIMSVKDGCAPQGQCGCCTVLVDGEPRVACVTPVTRVVGRRGHHGRGHRSRGHGTRSSGDCPPPAGRSAGSARRGSSCASRLPRRAARRRPSTVDRALAAHLCRCTGWQTIVEAIAAGRFGVRSVRHSAGTVCGTCRQRRNGRRSRAGWRSDVGPEVPLGHGGFADDGAPRDALVAVPLPPGSTAEAIEAAGDAVGGGRRRCTRRGRVAGKVQGRRTTVESAPPARAARRPAGRGPPRHQLGRARLPRARRVVVRARRRARRRRSRTAARSAARRARRSPRAARELADATGRTVRALYSREDVVRLGPKRPPIAAAAVVDGRRVVVHGAVARDADAHTCRRPSLPYRIGVRASLGARCGARAHRSPRTPRFVLADQHVLRGGSARRGRDRPRRRSSPTTGPRARCSTRAPALPSGATAGARVDARRAGPDRARGAAGRGRRPARRRRAALVRDRGRAHGAGLGAQRGDRPSIPSPARCSTSPSARSA